MYFYFMLFFLTLLIYVDSLDLCDICVSVEYDNIIDNQIVTQKNLNFLFDNLITAELHKFKLFVLDIKNNLLKLNELEEGRKIFCVNVRIIVLMLSSFIKINKFRLVIINEKSKLSNIIKCESSLEILNIALDRMKSILNYITNRMHIKSSAIIPIDSTNYDPSLLEEVRNTNDELFVDYTNYIENNYDNYKLLIKEIYK